jgi:hypothetical protein
MDQAPRNYLLHLCDLLVDNMPSLTIKFDILGAMWPQIPDIVNGGLDVMLDVGSAWLIKTFLRSQVCPPPSPFRKPSWAREGDNFHGKRIPQHPTAHRISCRRSYDDNLLNAPA